jgi:hypothetical protein
VTCVSLEMYVSTLDSFVAAQTMGTHIDLQFRCIVACRLRNGGEQGYGDLAMVLQITWCACSQGKHEASYKRVRIKERFVCASVSVCSR